MAVTVRRAIAKRKGERPVVGWFTDAQGKRIPIRQAAAGREPGEHELAPRIQVKLSDLERYYELHIEIADLHVKQLRGERLSDDENVVWHRTIPQLEALTSKLGEQFYELVSRASASTSLVYSGTGPCPRCGQWAFEEEPREDLNRCEHCGFEMDFEQAQDYFGGWSDYGQEYLSGFLAMWEQAGAFPEQVIALEYIINAVHGQYGGNTSMIDDMDWVDAEGRSIVGVLSAASRGEMPTRRAVHSEEYGRGWRSRIGDETAEKLAKAGAGERPVGFYTDAQGRKRPITAPAEPADARMREVLSVAEDERSLTVAREAQSGAEVIFIAPDETYIIELVPYTHEQFAGNLINRGLYREAYIETHGEPEENEDRWSQANLARREAVLDKLLAEGWVRVTSTAFQFGELERETVKHIETHILNHLDSYDGSTLYFEFLREGERGYVPLEWEDFAEDDFDLWASIRRDLMRRMRKGEAAERPIGYYKDHYGRTRPITAPRRKPTAALTHPMADTPRARRILAGLLTECPRVGDLPPKAGFILPDGSLVPVQVGSEEEAGRGLHDIAILHAYRMADAGIRFPEGEVSASRILQGWTGEAEPTLGDWVHFGFVEQQFVHDTGAIRLNTSVTPTARPAITDISLQFSATCPPTPAQIATFRGMMNDALDAGDLFVAMDIDYFNEAGEFVNTEGRWWDNVVMTHLGRILAYIGGDYPALEDLKTTTPMHERTFKRGAMAAERIVGWYTDPQGRKRPIHGPTGEVRLHPQHDNEKARTLIDQAVELFGFTDSIADAMYILPSGDLLAFPRVPRSTLEQLVAAEPATEYVIMREHEDIQRAYKRTDTEVRDFVHYGFPKEQFVTDTGAIRVDLVEVYGADWHLSLEMNHETAPTSRQMAAIRRQLEEAEFYEQPSVAVDLLVHGEGGRLEDMVSRFWHPLLWPTGVREALAFVRNPAVAPLKKATMAKFRPIGFYTDPQGKRRPITPRRGFRPRQPRLPLQVPRHIFTHMEPADKLLQIAHQVALAYGRGAELRGRWEPGVKTSDLSIDFWRETLTWLRDIGWVGDDWLERLEAYREKHDYTGEAYVLNLVEDVKLPTYEEEPKLRLAMDLYRLKGRGKGLEQALDFPPPDAPVDPVYPNAHKWWIADPLLPVYAIGLHCLGEGRDSIDARDLIVQLYGRPPAMERYNEERLAELRQRLPVAFHNAGVPMHYDHETDMIVFDEPLEDWLYVSFHADAPLPPAGWWASLSEEQIQTWRELGPYEPPRLGKDQNPRYQVYAAEPARGYEAKLPVGVAPSLVRELLAITRQVHRLPLAVEMESDYGTPLKIEVGNTRKESCHAQYFGSSNIVSIDDTHSQAFWHEFGHALDFQYFGEGGYETGLSKMAEAYKRARRRTIVSEGGVPIARIEASDEDLKAACLEDVKADVSSRHAEDLYALMLEFRKERGIWAWLAERTIRWRENDYWGEPSEQFARAYEQWLVYRLMEQGNASVRRMVANNVVPGSMWTPHEFEPIKAIYDRIFDNLETEGLAKATETAAEERPLGFFTDPQGRRRPIMPKRPLALPAPLYGQRIINHDQVEEFTAGGPFPGAIMFHATNALQSVRQHGLMSRNERQMRFMNQVQGLGGGEAMTVSVTVRAHVAQSIVEILHHAHWIVMADEPFAEVEAILRRTWPGLYDWQVREYGVLNCNTETGGGEGGRRLLALYEAGLENVHDPTDEEGDRLTVGECRARGWKVRDYRHIDKEVDMPDDAPAPRILRPATHAETAMHAIHHYAAVRRALQTLRDMPDPYLHMPGYEDLREVRLDELGVVAVASRGKNQLGWAAGPDPSLGEYVFYPWEVAVVRGLEDVPAAEDGPVRPGAGDGRSDVERIRADGERILAQAYPFAGHGYPTWIGPTGRPLAHYQPGRHAAEVLLRGVGIAWEGKYAPSHHLLEAGFIRVRVELERLIIDVSIEAPVSEQQLATLADLLAERKEYKAAYRIAWSVLKPGAEERGLGDYDEGAGMDALREVLERNDYVRKGMTKASGRGRIISWYTDAQGRRRPVTEHIARISPEEELLERAVDIFGVTEDAREVGFVLPDGQMLDFSGRSHGGPTGHRHLDHSEIGQVFNENDHRELALALQRSEPPREVFSALTGAIRVAMAEDALAISVHRMPTQAQMRRLKAAFDETLEWSEDGEKRAFFAYDLYDPFERGMGLIAGKYGTVASWADWSQFRRTLESRYPQDERFCSFCGGPAAYAVALHDEKARVWEYRCGAHIDLSVVDPENVIALGEDVEKRAERQVRVVGFYTDPQGRRRPITEESLETLALPPPLKDGPRVIDQDEVDDFTAEGGFRGDIFYHATNNLSSVAMHGLLSLWEREARYGRLVQGLGGGAGETVSLTNDMTVARSIVEILHHAHAICTADDPFAQAEEFFAEFAGYRDDELRPQADEFYERLHRDLERDRSGFETEWWPRDEEGEVMVMAQCEARGWECKPETLTSGPGALVRRARRPADHSEKAMHALEWYRLGRSILEHERGILDPLLWTPHYAEIRDIRPEELGVVVVVTEADETAREVSGLGEFVFNPEDLAVVRGMADLEEREPEEHREVRVRIRRSPQQRIKI